MATYNVNILRWEPQSSDIEVEADNACEAMGKAKKLLTETNGTCCDSWEIVQRDAKHTVMFAARKR